MVGRRGMWAGFGLAAALLGPVGAAAEPGVTAVSDWVGFRRALAACWSVPADTAGSLIAFRFGVDRTGAIRGTPLVTARRLVGDADARSRYEEAARAALARCFPMRITPSFGAALGESPIRLRFVDTPPAPAYQINSNITIFAPQDPPQDPPRRP